VEGINTTGCYLVPRGDRSRHRLNSTPVPWSHRHDASHLGLGGLVLLRINPHKILGPKVHVRGDGVFQMASGSAILASHSVTTRIRRMKESPPGVTSHTIFLPNHMCWLKHSRVLSPKACGTLTVLYRDNTSSRSYSHTSALPHSSQANRSNTRDSWCRRVGGPGREKPLLFTGA
jgi:hypothetical protein